MRISKLLPILALSISFAWAAPASTEMEKLSIAFPPAVDFLPVMMSKENGCFERRNIDAKLVVLPVVTNIPPGIMSGAIQIGMSTPTSLLATGAGGLPIVAIAGASRSIKGRETISVLGAPKYPIADAKDLIGRKVGIPGILSVGDIVFRAWLEKGGVDPKEVHLVEVTFPQMPEMVRSGILDAVVAAEPVRSRMEKGDIVVRSKTEFFSDVLPDAIMTLWTADATWANKHQAAIAGFRECLQEGIDAITADPAKANQAQNQYLKYATDFRPHYTTQISADDLVPYVSSSKEFGLIKTDIDVKKLVLPN